MNRTPEEMAAEVMAGRSVGRAKTVGAPRDPDNPLMGVTKFISRREKNKRLRIGPLPEDYEPDVAGYVLDHAADDIRTFACVKAAKGQFLVFSRHYEPNEAGVMEPTDKGAFPTESAPIIEWLRHRIRMGIFTDIYEDVSMIDIPCPEGCGFSAKNTESGRAKIGTHLLEAHYAKGATSVAAPPERSYALPPEPIASRPMLRDETAAAAAAKAKAETRERRSQAGKAAYAKAQAQRKEVPDQRQAAA